MKQVFNNSEVPHIWASQRQDKGRNSQGNFYFEYGTIYSYGGHFPIATIEGRDVFFTLRSYSNTTAKHIGAARQAASHLNFIYCFEVPVKWNQKKSLKQSEIFSTHETNLKRWKQTILATFKELGNTRIRDTQSRINSISRDIEQMNIYCQYFNLKQKDKELQAVLSLVNSPDFINKAREAKANEAAILAAKMKKAEKAYQQYLNLWRQSNEDAIQELTAKVKELCNFYRNQSTAFTHLRYNKDQNRIETSKGVQIPAEVAKRAYLALNGCLEGKCSGLNIPVLGYTITETTDKALIAGCHTIPKEDVKYIANLCGWLK